jgi:hypothetical protein
MNVPILLERLLPVKRCCSFWRILSGGKFQIYIFASQVAPSTTYKLFLTPWQLAPDVCPFTRKEVKEKTSSVMSALSFSRTGQCGDGEQRTRSL